MNIATKQTVGREQSPYPHGKAVAAEQEMTALTGADSALAPAGAGTETEAEAEADGELDNSLEMLEAWDSNSASPGSNGEWTWEEERARLKAPGLAKGIVAWIIIMHLGALTAPFFFSWHGLGLMVGLHWLTGSIGICLGFHRLFTHRSFKTSRPMRWLIAWIGGLAGEGSCIHWVANHRKHHALSDQVGDPHSPLDGPWWSHIFWCLWQRGEKEYETFNHRWAPDLANDRFLRFLDRTFILWHLVFGFTLFGIGYAVGGTMLAWSYVLWGVCLRMVLVMHVTWLVNSASHIWGYRTYQTTDESRNNWLVALFSYGEGWHNNHHAFPTLARAGHKWWEIDTTFWVIKGLRACGLVWDVVDGHHKSAAGRKKLLQ